MWVIGKGIEWQGRNSARPWQTSLLAATAPPAFGARWPTAGRRPCLVYAIPFGHRRQSRPYHVAAGTLPREEASRGRPVELGGKDAPALDGTDPEFAWMVALVDAVSTTACWPRAASCRSQARRADCEKPDPTGMISSTFQPWPILSSSGPPLTCHVPDLFSRASEFLHSYCVRWGLGGSHGVAPA